MREEESIENISSNNEGNFQHNIELIKKLGI